MVQANPLCWWVYLERKCLCNQNNGFFVFLVMDYDIPMSIEQCRAKLREEFIKNKDVSDIRVIDMLVVKVSCFGCVDLSQNNSYNDCCFRDKWNWRKLYRSGNKKDTSCATGKNRKTQNLQISYRSSSMDRINMILCTKDCYKF